MRTVILRVVSQSDVTYVPSQKTEGGQLARCGIRLKEFGGTKYGNEYVATLFGNLAQCRFAEGDVVMASLRFQVREVNNNCFQDIVVNDIIKINRL